MYFILPDPADATFLLHIKLVLTYLISRPFYFCDISEAKYSQKLIAAKINTSNIANEASQRNTKTHRRELTFHWRDLKINSRENVWTKVEISFRPLIPKKVQR